MNDEWDQWRTGVTLYIVADIGLRVIGWLGGL